MTRTGRGPGSRSGATPTASPGGFTLVELLLGLAVLGILAGVVAVMVTGASRVAVRATQSLLADRAVQSLEGFLQQELGNAVQGDITVLAAAGVGLERPVGDATVCASGGAAIVIADSAWSGTRPPQPGRDEAWVLLDPVNEVWQSAAIIDTAADTCPNAAPGLRIGLGTPAIGAGIVRVLEPVELTSYRSGTADWLGLTPASHVSAVQPFAGPLALGTTRWALYPDRLETWMQPSGTAGTMVITPIAPGP